MAGGHAWRGACMAGGLAWQGGMCGRGACMAGGIHSTGVCMAGGGMCGGEACVVGETATAVMVRILLEYIIVMHFSAKILPNSRCLPQTQGLAPPSGKSWIRQ